MTGMVGSVTRQRYDELVGLGRDWVETLSGVQWQLGDAGLELEPLRSCGGANPSGSEELFTVSEAIRMFAEDVGLAYSTVRDYRWVASRWPKEHRRTDVSHTIHEILVSIPDEQERFEVVDNPPFNPRGGPARWTHDSAMQIAGWKVDTPESIQEKVDMSHTDPFSSHCIRSAVHARHVPTVSSRSSSAAPLAVPHELREHRPRLRLVEQVPHQTGRGGQFSPPGYLLSRHLQHHARSTTPRRLRRKISGCSTCSSRTKR
jgi:hypothetical protein